MIYLSKKEECRLCEEEWIFQQNNDAMHNASITKKYLLEQNIRLLDRPVCSPELNHRENVWGLIIAKVYETVPNSFCTQKRNLTRMRKNTFG